jgi:phosphohistidine phosphatase
MTTLYVVRHAIAEQRDPERWPEDGARPLSAKGEARFRRAARGLRRIAADVDVVLSSPYVRAWRTAEILHEEASWPAPQRCEALEAERAPGDGVAALNEHGSAAGVAVVGHEPYLSGLVSDLAGDFALDLKKGAVVCLETAAGSGTVRWIATPRILRALAGG